MARRSKLASTALVAAASRPLVDQNASVPKQAAVWQAEAWTMFDEIGEVKYACNLAGNAMAKLRLFAAVRPSEDPEGDPIPVEELEDELPPDLPAVANAEVARLNQTVGGMPELLRSLNINLEVAGELWLVGWDERRPGEAYGPQPETWEVRSVSEVTWHGGGGERSVKVLTPGESPRDVVKGRDAVIRVWVRHPRYGDLADSNLRGVLADCRALLVLQQQSIAESRSRMNAGAFTVPNELTIAPPTRGRGGDPAPGDDPESDPFLLRLEDAMIDAVEDLSSPSSVAPFVIRGPAEFLQPQYLRRIDLGRGGSGEIEAKIEARVQRLARGMNLPPEVIMGHQQTTYANAAQVDEDTFEDHYEPRARLLVDTLTTAYLRPGLLDAGFDPVDVARVFVWYDPALLLSSPDTESNADDAFRAQAISWAAYRRAKGFSEADAPSGHEQLTRAGLLRGQLTTDLTVQLLNLLEDPRDEPVPRLEAPAPASGGGGPAYSDPSSDAAAAQIEAQVRYLAAAVEAGLLVVGPDGTLGPPPFSRPVLEAGSFEVVTAAGSPTEDAPGRYLLSIDQETRARLQGLFDAALERALERAGNRVRAKAQTTRSTLRRVAPRDVISTLGPTILAAAGLDDDDLLADAFTQLESEFKTMGGKAQARALTFASRLVGGMEPSVRKTYGLRQADDLDTAWRWVDANLKGLAKARLYQPDPQAPDLGEFDPTAKVPTGMIRQAMRQAGGARGTLAVSTNGEGSAWISVPDGSEPGGIATGQLIADIIRDEGGSIQGYRWVYGPADRARPFHPHLALDGYVFSSFTDPGLVISSGFPGTGHYIPGDHVGCICDVEPIILSPAQVAQMVAEGRYVAPPPPPVELADEAYGPEMFDVYDTDLGPHVFDNYGKVLGPWHHDLYDKVLGPHIPPDLGDIMGPTKAPPRLFKVKLGPKAPTDLADFPLGPDKPPDLAHLPLGPTKPADLAESALGPIKPDLADEAFGPVKPVGLSDTPLGPAAPHFKNLPSPDDVGAALNTLHAPEIKVGDVVQQWQGAKPIRQVKVIAVNGDTITVEGLRGKTAGVQYDVTTRQLLAPSVKRADQVAAVAEAVVEGPPLGTPRFGTTSFEESRATLATSRTAAGRGFAFDGPDIEHMHVHAAPTTLKRSSSATAARVTEYRFKLTDQGASRWREAILPQGDAVNARTVRPQYGKPRLGFARPIEERKAVWKEAGWTVKKGVRVPDPGIAAQHGGLAEVDLGKVTVVRNKTAGGSGKYKLSWSSDDGQQAKWTGKFKGRNVTIEYADVAANDKTATAIHNEVRIWVEGLEAPDERYFADLMEHFKFVRRVGVPDDGDIAQYAEDVLLNKLGTPSARKAVYARQGGGVGYDPSTVHQAMRLSTQEADDAITAALADIKTRFGIGPDDLVLTNTLDGRTILQLSDQATQRLIDETGVTFFSHSLHHTLLSDPDKIADMLTGEQGGLLSGRRRMADGLPFGGLSAARDFETGGADYVFTRHQNVGKWDSSRSPSGQVIFDNDRLRDLDWFAYRSDLYGQTHINGYYGQVDFVSELKEGAGRSVSGNYGQETMFRDVLAFEHMQAIYLERSMRDRVLFKLTDRGITHIGGRRIDEVIKVAGLAGGELDPVLVPGGRHAPSRFDPNATTTTPKPLTNAGVGAISNVPGAPGYDPLKDPTVIKVIADSVVSLGPTASIAMVENGTIAAEAQAAWATQIKIGLVEKYKLEGFVGISGNQVDPLPGDFVSIITDYGWDMADNDEFGAKIIKELADKYLDPADAALIKQWKL